MGFAECLPNPNPPPPPPLLPAKQLHPPQPRAVIRGTFKPVVRGEIQARHCRPFKPVVREEIKPVAFCGSVSAVKPAGSNPRAPGYGTTPGVLGAYPYSRASLQCPLLLSDCQIEPLLSPRIFCGGYRAPAVEAGVGAGAAASEVVPPWRPKSPYPPWRPPVSPSWTSLQGTQTPPPRRIC